MLLCISFKFNFTSVYLKGSALNLKKKIRMKCVYMSKFRKWKPVSVALKDSKIVTKKELYEIQKK